MINSVIFIVRYFGGKKLGIPGLIEAYSNASKLLIDLNQLKKWFPTTFIRLEYPYNLENTLNNLFKKFNVVIKTYIAMLLISVLFRNISIKEPISSTLFYIICIIFLYIFI